MKFNENDYFEKSGFLSQLWSRIKRGEIGKAIVNLYKNIRKYTVISGIFRAITIAVALFEKSAVLLLFASCLIMVLPILLSIFLMYGAAILIKTAALKKEISEWLDQTEYLTVFLISKRISPTKSEHMFLRQARAVSSNSNNPVIVVCGNCIIFPKWVTLNLLAINTDSFYLLKRFLTEKFSSKTVFIVL